MANELTENDVVVVLFHDHATRYIGKMFNDDWMRERGFLEEEKTRAMDLIKDHQGKHLVVANPNDPTSQVIQLMHHYKISQIPVIENGEFIGSLSDSHLFQKLLVNPELKELPVRHIMEKAFPIVDENASIEQISKLFTNEVQAVIVKYAGDKFHIITRQDMIKAIC